MSEETEREQARQRAEMILKVRGGAMTAAEAARALGISRKTYYKWEKRGLSGMLEGLCERNSGRPALARDGAKEMLEKTTSQLEKERIQRREAEEIRKALRAEGEKKEQ